MFGQVKGQEESRRVDHFIDQHGREYVSNVEKETGDPCTTLVALYTAPLGPDWFTGQLVPHEKYRKMVPQHLRARKRYQVEIDYAQWLADLDVRDEEWRQKLHDFARGAAKGGADIVAIVSDPPPVIKELAGAPPFPPRVLVEAMAAGNAWALGLDERVPTKAVALLEALKPVVMRRVVRESIGEIDPLADDAAASDFTNDLMANTAPDPFEDLLDVEEAVDPDATGGQRVPVGRSKRR